MSQDRHGHAHNQTRAIPGAGHAAHRHGQHPTGHEPDEHDHNHGGHDHGGHDHGGHDHGGHDHGGHDHGGHDDHDHGTGLWVKVKHHITPHSHDSNEAIQSAEQSSGEGIRAAWIGLAGMAVTAILQVFIVAISNSIALLADTLHNVGHAVTTIPLIIAFKIGQRVASKRYSYGYRRAEDLVGVFISLVIAISAGLIIWESVKALVDPRPLTNLWWVFAAGLIGAAGNEMVALYRIRAGKRIGSAALIAEGQHARADGFTSIAVVVGVIGVWLGFPQADALIGFLIAIAILWILISSLRTTLRRLMDGIEPDVIDNMTAVARHAPGVVNVDRVRARWSGHRLEADASITVANTLSVLEGHQVAENLEHELLHKIPHLETVIVHLHPVDSEPADLHELTAHHASAEARLAYQARHATARDDLGVG